MTIIRFAMKIVWFIQIKFEIYAVTVGWLAPVYCPWVCPDASVDEYSVRFRGPCWRCPKMDLVLALISVSAPFSREEPKLTCCYAEPHMYL